MRKFFTIVGTIIVLLLACFVLQTLFGGVSSLDLRRPESDYPAHLWEKNPSSLPKPCDLNEDYHSDCRPHEECRGSDDKKCGCLRYVKLSHNTTVCKDWAKDCSCKQKSPRGDDCAQILLTSSSDVVEYHIQTAKENVGPLLLTPQLNSVSVSINATDKYARITVPAGSMKYKLLSGSVEVLTEKDPKKKGQTKEITLLLTCKTKDCDKIHISLPKGGNVYIKTANEYNLQQK